MELPICACVIVAQPPCNEGAPSEWRRLDVRLGPWECIACPPGVIHGYINDSLEPVYFQVMLGRARPYTMGYADEQLYQRRDAHLKG